MSTTNDQGAGVGRQHVAASAQAKGGWLTRVTAWFGSNASEQRQMPEPLSAAQMRSAPPLAPLPPFGAALYHPIPRYDWGAAGYAYVGGKVQYNPIGAGVVVRQKPPVTPSATARVVNKTSIFWNSQMVNSGIQPVHGPLVTPAMLAALTGALASQAMVPTK